MSDTHAQTVAFVRDTMLPQKAPPLTETGAIKWMRENLFSGWLNSILTVLSLYFVFWVLSHVGPWFANTVWNAGSLAECREILAGTDGACFAVIRDRWHQLLYGFYPDYLYWRPNLTLLLMFVALAPVLFTQLPRKMLWFSVIYPALAYWLLWGGSIWGPVLILLTAPLVYGVYLLVSRFADPLFAFGAALAAAA